MTLQMSLDLTLTLTSESIGRIDIKFENDIANEFGFDIDIDIGIDW